MNLKEKQEQSVNDSSHDGVAQPQENPVLLQPDNHNKKYESLFVEIDTGQFKLPMFQREFVWDKEQSAKLIDSILKGFPIGTFIFWKTKEELRSYKEVGNHKLPATPKGDYVQYILDGQQRITSLYAIRKGIRINKDGKELDYKDIFINLDFEPENDEQIVVTEKQDGKSYQGTELTIDPKLIEETGFSAGNAYCKAILCLLAYQQPKSFDTNGIVILDNSHLKIATSRNYHHFFPTACLATAAPNERPNLIANITLIDGYSNKHGIGKKPPSKYIGKFAKSNKSLSETLQTHLIKDADAYGVNADDYDRFIERRAKAIALALNVKLMSMTPVQAAKAEAAA